MPSGSSAVRAALDRQDHFAADAGNTEEALQQKRANEQGGQAGHHMGDDRDSDAELVHGVLATDDRGLDLQ